MPDEMLAADQRSRVVYQLSQLIIRGELVPGEKLAEIPLAERFGVSRTPIRHALSVLANEGLLIKDAGRSYVVRRFSLEEILNAIEVRAVLEGLAAREVAQRRMPRGLLRELESILAEAGEVISAVEEEGPSAPLTEKYFDINARFHRAIVEGANNRSLVNALIVTGKVPFVSVGSMARYSDITEDTEETIREKRRLLLFSHMQHQDILEALTGGQATRAESLMREHAQLGVRNLHLRDNVPIELAASLPAGAAEG